MQKYTIEIVMGVTNSFVFDTDFHGRCTVIPR